MPNAPIILKAVNEYATDVFCPTDRRMTRGTCYTLIIQWAEELVHPHSVIRIGIR